MFDSIRTWAALKMLPGGVKAAEGNFAQAIMGGAFNLNSYPKPNAAQLLSAYNSMPWLRAVVNKIAHTTSVVPWKLYRVVNSKDQKGVRLTKMQHGDWQARKKMLRRVKTISRDLEVEEVTDHPILTLLSEGSDLFPGFITSQIVQTHMDLVGEACQIKERSKTNIGPDGRGVIRKLLPIPPTWIKSLPTPSEPTYSIQFASSGNVDEIPAADVIYYRDPNPSDPFGRGSGIAGALGDELQGNQAASLTIRTRLENNSIPPFVAMPKSDMGMPPDEKQVDRIQQRWNEKLGGPNKNKGIVHFLRTAFEIVKLGNTFDELNLIPLLQNQRDTILQVYGIPPEIMGIIQNSNRATIDAADTLMARHVIVPRMEFRRAVLQRQLVNEIDDTLILDYESPVPEDKEFELKVLQSLPWPFTADEIRVRAGEDALPDDKGKVFSVPTSSFIQTDLLEEDDHDHEDPEPGASEEQDDPNKPPPTGDPKTASQEAVSKSNKDKAKRIAKAAKSSTLIKRVMPTFKDSVKLSGQQRLNQLDIQADFDMSDPYVVRFLKQEAGKQIVGINNTTQKKVAKTLAAGYEAGENINQLAARVRGVFSAAEGRRSVVIARTESIRALNGGQAEATRQAGFEGLQWLSTRDDQVRDTHAPGTGLDGDIVPIGEDFKSPSGASGPYPGSLGTPEEDIQCRCTTISIAKIEDVEEDGWDSNHNTEEKRVRVWRAAERIRVPVERRLRKAFSKAFAEQEADVLAALQSQGTDS